MMLFVLLILQSPDFLIAQGLDWQSIPIDSLKKENLRIDDFYSKLSVFSVRIESKSYKDSISSEVADVDEGYYHKYKSSINSFLFGIRTIQNDKYLIIIDEHDKSIEVRNPNANQNFEVMMADDSSFNENVSSVKRCIKGKDTYLRIEYPNNLELMANEYVVSPSGWVTEITSFYQVAVENDDESIDIVYPILKVKYLDFNLKFTPSEKEFDESKYFTIVADKMVLQPEYQAYSLNDNRKKN